MNEVSPVNFLWHKGGELNSFKKQMNRHLRIQILLYYYSSEKAPKFFSFPPYSMTNKGFERAY